MGRRSTSLGIKVNTGWIRQQRPQLTESGCETVDIPEQAAALQKLSLPAEEIFLPYLPYFSNCRGFGRTIPRGALRALPNGACPLIIVKGAAGNNAECGGFRELGVLKLQGPRNLNPVTCFVLRNSDETRTLLSQGCGRLLSRAKAGFKLASTSNMVASKDKRTPM